jgi:thymidylate synthase ThyX
MDVKLAGYNVDVDSINELKENNKILIEYLKSNCERANAGLVICDALRNVQENQKILNNMTPETICASYARISRDSRAIPELRKDSRDDVESARKSNSAIIFSMGHKSIAEHAVFNFDIMGISRKTVETLEKKRLCSYTEKSQRYITLKGDYVVPQEIMDSGFAGEFKHVVENVQNKFYFDNLKSLQEWHAKNPETKALLEKMGIVPAKFKTQEAYENKVKETIEGWGKEDARYALSMATQAQVGETISARNLETLVTELRSSSVKEEQELGKKLFECVDGVAPSVIKYTEPTDYFAKTRKELKAVVNELMKLYNYPEKSRYSMERVRIYENMLTDDLIMAGLVFSSTKLSFEESLDFVEGLNNHERKKKIRDASIRYKTKHDPLLREYELCGSFVAEMVMSSSAFAQMKRHRMNTIISQDYDVNLGVTIPDSIIGIEKEDEFMKVMELSNEFYDQMKSDNETKEVADYILTNAHRRRILFDANIRQISAFSSERENLFAQWDIRKTANEYVKKMKNFSPLTLDLACGKHEYDDIKKKVLGE